MALGTENKVRPRKPLWLCIAIVVVLYLLQGVMLGLVDVVPIYLTSYGVTWKQLGILSFAMYPFTLKLLWAPFIDVFYIRRLGRRQTWLLPVQVILGVMLIFLSFNLEFLLVQLHVLPLTIIFFFLIFFTATQDICVDGWALTLFPSSDIIWQSISQTIGQPLGSFLGSPILLTFESANMTNRLIRQPLGIPVQSYGLFTLAQFVRFWGILFLFSAAIIVIFFREQSTKNDIYEKESHYNHINLFETYLYIVKLFKKKCFRQLIFLLVGPHVGYAATSAMTYVMLMNRTIIRRETLGLIMMLLILVKVTVPLLLSRTRRPLVFYAQSYVPRLVLCVLIALFIYFSPRLQLYQTIFHVLLIMLLALNDAFVYLQGAARGGFFAYISDKRIGSTYYTLLASLNNVGQYVSSSVVLYTANWLPKNEAYFIEVGVCLLLGCVWLCLSWRLTYRLQALPVERWHVTDHHQKIITVDQDSKAASILNDTDLPS